MLVRVEVRRRAELNDGGKRVEARWCGSGEQSSSPCLFARASVMEVGSSSTHVELADGGASRAHRRGRRNLHPKVSRRACGGWAISGLFLSVQIRMRVGNEDARHIIIASKSMIVSSCAGGPPPWALQSARITSQGKYRLLLCSIRYSAHVY